MLDRTTLRRQLIKKLKVYAGPEHPHQAQQPKPFPLRCSRGGDELMSARYYEAVGRRKTSSARVRLYPGTGNIVVNDRPVDEYFDRGDRRDPASPGRCR